MAETAKNAHLGDAGCAGPDGKHEDEQPSLKNPPTAGVAVATRANTPQSDRGRRLHHQQIAAARLVATATPVPGSGTTETPRPESVVK